MKYTMLKEKVRYDMTTFVGLQQLGDLCFDSQSGQRVIAAGQGGFEKTEEQCPHCQNATLESMPILDAERKGIVKIDHEVIRDMARKHDTQFVICPNCGWWGCPDRE